jgi:CRP-like cAMP-binding protein
MHQELQHALSTLFQQSDVMERISQTVEDLGERLVLPKKSIVVKEGDKLSHLYLLKSGSVKTYYVNDGNIVVTGFTFEKEPIPIRFLSSSQEIAADTVETIEETEVLRLPYEMIVEKVLTDQQISIMALAAMNHFLMLAQTRIDSFQAKGAKERYLHLMKTRPQLLNRVKLADVASYLGISQVSLSRIRAQI